MNERLHLTSGEIERLLKATHGARHEARDRCLILLMFRHGLRVSELCGMTLDQLDVDGRILHVARLKGGLSTTHPLRTDELRVVKRWLAIRAKMNVNDRHVFLSERRKPLNRRSAWYLVKRYGELADLPLSAHPHMLRHGCGFALADQGADTRLIQDYLGHRSIQNTVRYTAANPLRFEKLWR